MMFEEFEEKYEGMIGGWVANEGAYFFGTVTLSLSVLRFAV